MRAARLAIPIAVLALTVAGCGGGSKVVVKEVPGGSVDLTVPGGDALAPRATPTPTADASETPTPDASGTTSGGAATTQTQPQATTQPQQAAPTATAPPTSANGGATAPDAQATPPPGASKQQFETFCQQNPGAC